MGVEVNGIAVVTRKGLRRARRGEPWLSHADVVRYDGDGGPFVDLCDETSLPMGTALWDGEANPAVRLLSSARTRDPIGLLLTRIERALARREAELGEADAARLVNGEADGVPGLVVDRFGDGLLVSIGCRPMERIVELLLPALVARAEAETVVVAKSGGVVLVKGADPSVAFQHGRLELTVDLTAINVHLLTADLERQRALRRFARGRVLDLFAGSCGYGLQLADAGAPEVVLVDEPSALSRTVLDEAARNALSARLDRVEMAPRGWLAMPDAERQRFGVIVFHPPLVEGEPSSTAHQRAIEDAALCLRHLDEGGIFAAQPHAHGMSDEVFASALQDAAARSRKRLQILAHLESGPDHPVLAGVSRPPALLVTRVLTTA